MKPKPENEVMHFYCHIGNGGVSFVVLNDERFGPLLEVKASHFGQKTNGMSLATTADTLKKLGTALIAASEHPFSGNPYCYALEGELDDDTGHEPKQGADSSATSSPSDEIDN